MNNINTISNFVKPTEEKNESNNVVVKTDIETIKKEITEELINYGIAFGQINYILAKLLYEKTKNLDVSDTHKVYVYVSDFLGLTVKTIKNLVWVYRKLEKFNLWHNESGIFKLRLFQLVYYILKNCNESDVIIQKLYYEIINDFKLKIWFERASYKEILNWAKERFKTYFRVFKGKGFGFVTCDICNTTLKPEDYNKTWFYVPMCHRCYDYMKEENKEKIHILKNTIAKSLKEKEVDNLKEEVRNLKEQLNKVIEEYDKIRLKKSRKFKKIMDTITSEY